MGKAILIAVVGFGIILGAILLNQNNGIVRAADALNQQYYNIIRNNSVESATNVAISKLFSDYDWRDGFTNLTFSGTSYSVSVAALPGDSTVEAKKVRARIAVSYEGGQDTTDVILMQPAYSYFSYYSTQWPGHVTFGSGDTLRYPIHSNGQIRMTGNPVFTGKVSSAQPSFATVVTAEPRFYGGAEFGTPDVPLPDFSALKDSALAAGDQYNQEVWLIFNAGGTYQCSTSTILTVKNIADYNGTIITTADKDIHVQGSLQGAVTIVSDRDLWIEGPVTYNTNPAVDPTSTDYLGLVADRDLIIADEPATAAGVVVQAAILVRRDMRVENHDVGTPRGNLVLYGSIGQENAEPFGTFSGSILQTGYNAIISYDRRLFDRTPPFFPRLTRIEQIYRTN